MSAPAFAWAMERGASLSLSPSDRLVLFCLANKLNGTTGKCCPSQGTIERDTGLAPKTIRAAIGRLVKVGLIGVEKRDGMVTHYRLAHRTPVNGAGGNPGKSSHSNPGKPSRATPVNGAGEPRQNVPPHPGTIFREPRHDLPLTPVKCAPEPLRNQEREPKNPPPIVPPPPGRDRASYPPDFDAFWEAYPRKAGKRAALKGWAGAVVRAGSASAIMAGLASHRFAHEERFIPHPATWLNRDQWLDEADSFDPVLRAVGLTPDDFADWPVPEGRLLQ